MFRPVRLRLPGTVLNLAARCLMARRQDHVQARYAAAAALAVVLAAASWERPGMGSAVPSALAEPRLP